MGNTRPDVDFPLVACEWASWLSPVPHTPEMTPRSRALWGRSSMRRLFPRPGGLAPTLPVCHQPRGVGQALPRGSLVSLQPCGGDSVCMAQRVCRSSTWDLWGRNASPTGCQPSVNAVRSALVTLLQHTRGLKQPRQVLKHGPRCP